MSNRVGVFLVAVSVLFLFGAVDADPGDWQSRIFYG
jgi:hypothetical protein